LFIQSLLDEGLTVVQELVVLVLLVVNLAQRNSIVKEASDLSVAF
jgi:hypothetical protein